MKYFTSPAPVRTRLVRLFAITLVLGILTASAENWLFCSDVVAQSSNTCNDACGVCSGTVYDYSGVGNLSCTLINKHCGTQNQGQNGTDCRDITYNVSTYTYVSAGGPCPPCVRQYTYAGPLLIHDVVTREDGPCAPSRPN